MFENEIRRVRNKIRDIRRKSIREKPISKRYSVYVCAFSNDLTVAILDMLELIEQLNLEIQILKRLKEDKEDELSDV